MRYFEPESFAPDDRWVAVHFSEKDGAPVIVPGAGWAIGITLGSDGEARTGTVFMTPAHDGGPFDGGEDGRVAPQGLVPADWSHTFVGLARRVDLDHAALGRQCRGAWTAWQRSRRISAERATEGS